MLHGDSEAGRRAIVEDVDREAIKADHFGKTVDNACDVVERVFERTPRRHVRLAETWQVGRDDVEAIGQERDEVPEHMACAWEAMKQQQRGRAGSSGVAIEDLKAVHGDSAIFDGSHGASPSLNWRCGEVIVHGQGAREEANEIFELPLLEPRVSDKRPGSKHTSAIQAGDI